MKKNLRQQVKINVNYTFSEKGRTSSATGMLFVQFIGVALGSAGGSPHEKFCSGNVNTVKSNFVTPY